MIAKIALSLLLSAVMVYAWHEYRRFAAVASMAALASAFGLYFVWFPEQATRIAELVGIGRGVDLILYIWVCISLLVLVNLHLKIRIQSEMVTSLARAVALADARSRDRDISPAPPVSPT
jgi:hypothetical protein